ncbi:hypothetical protein KQX54_004704 [Cotesia glomerata]|uniref:Uncharacterized protein n=1 Tax=Cotesia glomerata TaxID=32391 RepID=A0AAV7IFR0_COTGL|nr:hypothetical protein KQX54_004704 [Cotesia glomerata]
MKRVALAETALSNISSPVLASLFLSCDLSSFVSTRAENGGLSEADLKYKHRDTWGDHLSPFSRVTPRMGEGRKKIDEIQRKNDRER